MREIIAVPRRILTLGKQGENMAVRIRFPVADEWRRLYGNGSFQLLHRRSTDVVPYPVSLDITGSDVYWTVSCSDVAYPGNGVCELIYLVGDAVAKSESFVTMTIPSLGSTGPVPSGPWQSWVDAVLQAGLNAEAAAERAALAVIHEPDIGKNGNWWIWDFESGQYTDTGVSAAPVLDHSVLSNRNLPAQHPISAIAGLTEALDSKGTYSKPSDGIPDSDIASAEMWNAKQSTAITDSGGYFTADTVESALQEIGAELCGINTLIGNGVIE